MHRVTTGRLLATVTTAGDTVLGTVPAGKVWQVFYVSNVSGTHLAGAVGEVRFRDSGGVVRVRVAMQLALATRAVVVNSLPINLAAGDQVVFNSTNASTWGAIVCYFER